jgi:hypothetical protein
MSDMRTKGSDGGDRHGDAAIGGVMMGSRTATRCNHPLARPSTPIRTTLFPEAMRGRRRVAMFGFGDERTSGAVSRSPTERGGDTTHRPRSLCKAFAKLFSAS